VEKVLNFEGDFKLSSTVNLRSNLENLSRGLLPRFLVLLGPHNFDFVAVLPIKQPGFQSLL
jgi:hypothetical protein